MDWVDGPVAEICSYFWGIFCSRGDVAGEESVVEALRLVLGGGDMSNMGLSVRIRTKYCNCRTSQKKMYRASLAFFYGNV